MVTGGYFIYRALFNRSREKKGCKLGYIAADLQFQFARRTLIRDASGRVTFDEMEVLSRLIPHLSAF